MSAPQNLSGIFNAFAEKAQQDHPQLRGELIIYDDDAKIFYGPAKASKRYSFVDDRLYAKQLEEIADYKKGSAKVFRMRAKYGGKVVDYANVIAYKNTPALDTLNDGNGGPGALFFTLYHELGHIVVKDAFGGEDTAAKNSRAEAAADVYALIRLRQLYPDTVDELVQRLIISRTMNLVEGADTEHYTLPAIDALRDAGWKELEKLTPAEAALRAGEIATANTLSQPVFDASEKVFKNFRAALKTDRQSALRGLAETLLQSDRGVFATGMNYLNLFLDGFVTRKGFETTGGYWDDMREKLKTRLDNLNPSTFDKSTSHAP